MTLRTAPTVRCIALSPTLEALVCPYVTTPAGWFWRLPAPCSLEPASELFFCETFHAFHAKQLRSHHHQVKAGSPLGHEMASTSQSPLEAILAIKRERSLVSKKDQPPIPPRCNLNSGKNCRLNNGSMHPAVRLGGAFKEADMCGHADQRVGPHVVLVGDSIIAGQLQALFGSSTQFRMVAEGADGIEHWRGGHVRSACGVHVSTYRSDRLQVKGGTSPNPCWVPGVCRANVAVINYGAHASGLERFTTDMTAVRLFLFSSPYKNIILCCVLY